MSNKPQYRLLEFGLSKKPWYRILIVNFYTELENYINFESTFVGVQKRIKINKKRFHNKSLDSELGTHVPSDESIFSFFTLLYLTLSCFLNISFGFLFFYLESAFKTKKKKENPFLFLTCATSLFQINFLVISCFWSHIIKEGKDYYSLDLGQDRFIDRNQSNHILNKRIGIRIKAKIIKKILSVFIFIYLDFLYFYITTSLQPFRKFKQPFRKSKPTFSHRKNRHIPQLTQNNPIWILVFFPLREFGFNYSCILLFYPLIDDPYFIGNRLLLFLLLFRIEITNSNDTKKTVGSILAKSISLFLFITISSA
ncbi:hypothetical protein ACJX0J_000072 [Zea mays]